MSRRRALPVAIGVTLVVALAAAALAAVTVGPAGLSAGDVAASIAARLGLAASPLTDLQDAIVWELRVPRILTAAAVGAGLALVGVVMQALTRTPLADPYLLGISSGADAGCRRGAAARGGVLLLPVAGVRRGASRPCDSRTRGGGGRCDRGSHRARRVAVSAFAAALALACHLPHRARRLVSRGALVAARVARGRPLGGVAISLGALAALGIPLALSGVCSTRRRAATRRRRSLGIRVGPARVVLLVTGALLTGAMVSVSGAIGFVGLVVPHAVRLLVGARHGALLPLSALAGALTLVAADTLARTVLDPRELPVGGGDRHSRGSRVCGAPRAAPGGRVSGAGPDATGLDATDLAVRRGDVTILDAVSLTAPRGAVTALLGRTERGKSTLLRALAGATPRSARGG